MLSLNRALFSLFLCLLAIQVRSQTLDSLQKVLEASNSKIVNYHISLQICDAYQKMKSLDSAKLYANKALVWATEIKDDSLMGDAYRKLAYLAFDLNRLNEADSLIDLALTYTNSSIEKARLSIRMFDTRLRKGEPDKGISYIRKARKYLGNDTTSQLMAQYYTSYAGYFGVKKNYLIALEYLQKAKKIAKANIQSTISHNLSNIYMHLGAYEKVLEIHEENRLLAQKEEDPLSELFALFGIVAANWEMGKQEEARVACFEAISLYEEYGVSSFLGYIYYHLGRIYMKQGILDSARSSFQQGIQLSIKQEEDAILGDNYSGMSNLMNSMGKLDSAKYYGLLARKNLPFIDIDLNNTLASIYAYEMDFQAAYKLQKENWAEYQSRESKKEQYKIIKALLEDKYKQQRYIEKQSYQQKTKLERLYLLVIILFLALLATVLFLRSQYRNAQKLKRLNNSLKHRNSILQHFAFITSHDLKEPVRSIKSFSDLLGKSLLSKENSENELQYVTHISKSSKTLGEIINSLRVFTQTTVDEVKREHINLSEVFETLKATINAELKKAGLSGTLNIINSDELSEVFFSRAMLLLLLQNLVLNGFKHNVSEKPTVTIEVQAQNKEVLFKVSDNGIGIKKAYQQTIFQPFKTLTNKSTTESSGLGLAICKGILDKAGGKIWVESDGISGSQFYFTI